MTKESLGARRFNYGKGYLVFKLTFALLIYLFAVFYLFPSMIYMLISGSFFLSLENFLITIALGFAFFGIFSNASGYINNFNEFIVSEKGIRVRIFNFWFTWKEIAWIDILWMKECRIADYERDKHWIIAIKRMTIWHKRRGKELGYKGVPVIEFNSNLKDIDTFISLMRERITEL